MQNKSNVLLPKPQVRIAPDGAVFLSLPGKSYKADRYIGRIVGDTLVVERNPERHMFRKTKAYGFNYDLIRNGNFSRVLVREVPSGRELETTRETILEYGQFLHFKSEKLEPQIFLRIADFGRRPQSHRVQLSEQPTGQFALVFTN